MAQLSFFDEPPAPKKKVPPKVSAAAKALRASGRDLRDQGAARAAAHAGEPWKDKAAKLFERYAKEHKGKTFTTEVAREWAELQGLGPPPDLRAWGHIAGVAARSGLIRRVDYVQYLSPSGHAGPRSLWLHE